ncbi:ABC transporter permease [Pullulanibacillus sp. KACC 23026]|uniref:oligopeptide ABC transporter permease n=1 Tax=Pullulanibacillus sp. KACC 23026 TaxID=3028315 RepID=UPI0023AE70BB|nr:oligopeptide ABC transporter permease [Pullulanibacillus sp. KACC 23026]WEG11924.1 ABC transporter permease [Pullulanibacillus sp. KACC 23026]
MTVEKDKLSKDLFTPADFSSDDKDLVSRPSIGFWKDAWIRLSKNRAAIVGLVVILFIVVMALIGPHMNKWGYNDQSLMRQNLPPKVHGLGWLGFTGKDGSGTDQYAASHVKDNFWFGTDSLGRDQWTRIWKGTQISLIIALVASIGDCLIGVAYGGISAYYGGRIDSIMQRFIELLIGIPNLILLILLILWLQPGMKSIILALIISGWTGMARLVRGQILKLKNQDFVLAARTLGSADQRIIWKHLIPNVLGQIIITLMFTIPSAIFFEAFLSYIGLGIAAPQASLGSLNQSGFQNLQIYPYQALFPALIISILMISFNLLADGLRDAFDPKMRK